MVEVIIFILLGGALIFVSNINLKKFEKNEIPIKTMKLVIWISRFFQLLIIYSVCIWLYQISYYLLNQGQMPKLLWAFNAGKAKTFIDWGLPVLLLFGIVNNIIYFGILEFVVMILKDYLKNSIFSEINITRLVMISNLFIIRIFILIIINYLESGTLYFGFEYLLIYGLMIVLIRVFTHAKLIQENSDFSI